MPESIAQERSGHSLCRRLSMQSTQNSLELVVTIVLLGSRDGKSSRRPQGRLLGSEVIEVSSVIDSLSSASFLCKTVTLSINILHCFFVDMFVACTFGFV